MSSVPRSGGIAPRQTKIACVPYDAAAEAATRVKEKLLIPIIWQREFQFELVLRRNVANHVTILLDLTDDLSSSTARTISAGMKERCFQAAGRHLDKVRGCDDGWPSKGVFQVELRQRGTFLCVRAGQRWRAA